MKSKEDIEKALRKLPADFTKFPAMTYEQGVDEALSWVIGEIPDGEFEYAP